MRKLGLGEVNVAVCGGPEIRTQVPSHSRACTLNFYDTLVLCPPPKKVGWPGLAVGLSCTLLPQAQWKWTSGWKGGAISGGSS